MIRRLYTAREWLRLSPWQRERARRRGALPPIAGGASAAQTFTPGTGPNAAPASAAQRARPFCQAAKVGTQLTGNWNQAVTTGSPQIGPTALTASGGFIKRVILEIGRAHV